MPIRKIPKNYRNITGGIASKKANEMAKFEASLERDLFVLLDFDWNVGRYDEQPVEIKFLDKTGVERKYTPDVLIEYRQDYDPSKGMKPKLCEVKPRGDLKKNWLEYKPKFRAAMRLAKKNGWIFRLITEREIRTPFLLNAKLLRRYRDQPRNFDDAEVILNQLYEMRETDPECLLAAIFDNRWNRAKLIPTLWHLVAMKRIGADLTQQLTMRSRIWSVN